MEKYCSSCGRVFKDSDFKICPYCGNQLNSRVGRQPIPRKLRHQVFQRDGYRCRECGATKEQTRLHVDHIKPVAKGGTNDINNLQTLCEKCNQAKYTDEWVGGQYNSKAKHDPLSEEERKRVELYKKLKNNLTEEQKELLHDHFRKNWSFNEILIYLVDRFNENQVNRLLDKIKKDKEFKRKLYNLTDSQLELFYAEFPQYKNYKDSLINFLSANYSEEEVYQILAQLQKEHEQKEIEHEESVEKLFKKLSDSLTDAQVKLLTDKFPHISNYSRTEVIRYFSERYSEEDIYLLLNTLENEKKNQISKAAYTNHEYNELRSLGNRFNVEFSEEGTLDYLSDKNND